MKSFLVFLPPKTDSKKNSHTKPYNFAMIAITQDDHRSQLELGPPVNPGELRRKTLVGTKKRMDVI